MNLLGVVAGLATAVLWSFTAICFEAAGRRIGSLAVNVLRLVAAALLFAGLSLVRSGLPWPAGLANSAWLNLALSGLVGFVIGDLLLFQALVLIGARLRGRDGGNSRRVCRCGRHGHMSFSLRIPARWIRVQFHGFTNTHDSYGQPARA